MLKGRHGPLCREPGCRPRGAASDECVGEGIYECGGLSVCALLQRWSNGDDLSSLFGNLAVRNEQWDRGAERLNEDGKRGEPARRRDDRVDEDRAQLGLAVVSYTSPVEARSLTDREREILD